METWTAELYTEANLEVHMSKVTRGKFVNLDNSQRRELQLLRKLLASWTINHNASTGSSNCEQNLVLLLG